MGKTILLGVLIVAGGILGWQCYDNSQKLSIKESLRFYARSYTQYATDENKLLDHIVTRRGYGGFLPEDLRGSLEHSVQTMLGKDGCVRIPDETLQNRCKDLFTQYQKSLGDLKMQGFIKPVGDPLKDLIPKVHDLMTEVIAKYPDVLKRVKI